MKVFSTDIQYPSVLNCLVLCMHIRIAVLAIRITNARSTDARNPARTERRWHWAADETSTFTVVRSVYLPQYVVDRYQLTDRNARSVRRSTIGFDSHITFGPARVFIWVTSVQPLPKTPFSITTIHQSWWRNNEKIQCVQGLVSTPLRRRARWFVSNSNFCS